MHWTACAERFRDVVDQCSLPARFSASSLMAGHLRHFHQVKPTSTPQVVLSTRRPTHHPLQLCLQLLAQPVFVLLLVLLLLLLALPKRLLHAAAAEPAAPLLLWLLA